MEHLKPGQWKRTGNSFASELRHLSSALSILPIELVQSVKDVATSIKRSNDDWTTAAHSLGLVARDAMEQELFVQPDSVPKKLYQQLLERNADQLDNPKQRYGDKKLKTQNVPPTAILSMARSLGEGGDKYGPFNWRDKPVELMTYYGALMRHMAAWVDGEDLDPDATPGVYKTHLDGAIGSLAILIDAVESGYAIDNRPKPGGSPRMILKGARNAELDPNAPGVPGADHGSGYGSGIPGDE